jgi:predicted amidohydrolase
MRPVSDWDAFASQVSGLVNTAADYKVKLVLFPEYFTTQLLTLEDTSVPIHELIRALAKQRDRYLELLTGLAKRHKVFIVGGTHPSLEGNKVYNDSHLFAPSGAVGVQGKVKMTRFEREEWLVSPRDQIRIFNTDIGKLGIAVCYDVEFPEIVRKMALEGMEILCVPSCTDDRHGYFRVRYCAQARAIENQLYAIHTGTIGSLPMIPAIAMNYGQASILTPSDFSFARDGILAEGNTNQEQVIVGELNMDILHESRTNGTVIPLLDSASLQGKLDKFEEVPLS